MWSCALLLLLNLSNDSYGLVITAIKKSYFIAQIVQKVPSKT